MAFAGGDGSVGNPYQIETPAQLLDIDNNLDKHFILNNDIDMASVSPFTPIGKSSAPFTGSLNGAGKTLSNLTPDASIFQRHPGLFSHIQNATIESLKINTFSISGSESGDKHIGAIASVNLGGSTIYCIDLTNITIEGCGLPGEQTVGGALGYSSGTLDISNVKISNLDISDPGEPGVDLLYLKAGGLIGQIWGGDSTINRCETSGTIVGLTDLAGLVGFANPSENGALNITNCGMNVNVLGQSNVGVGGCIGSLVIRDGVSVSLSNCYNTGDLTNETTGVGMAGMVANWDFNYTSEAAAGTLSLNECINTGNIISYGGSISGSGGLLGACDDISIDYEPSWNFVGSKVTTTNSFWLDTSLTGDHIYSDSIYFTPDIFGSATSSVDPYPNYLVLDCFIESFTISVEANPSSGGSPTVNGATSVTVESGTALTFESAAATGYNFLNWSKDGTAISELPATATEDATYIANYGVGYNTLLLRWKDEGKPWSNWRNISLSPQGDYDSIKRVLGLGSYTTRKYQLVAMVDKPIEIIVMEENTKLGGRRGE